MAATTREEADEIVANDNITVEVSEDRVLTIVPRDRQCNYHFTCRVEALVYKMTREGKTPRADKIIVSTRPSTADFAMTYVFDHDTKVMTMSFHPHMRLGLGFFSWDDVLGVL